MSGTSHLTHDVIRRYHLRTLTAAELLRLDDHLAECPGCRARVASPSAWKAVHAALQIQPSVGARHLTDEQLADWVDAILLEASIRTAQTHLTTCPQCSGDAIALQALKARLTAACGGQALQPTERPQSAQDPHFRSGRPGIYAWHSFVWNSLRAAAPAAMAIVLYGLQFRPLQAEHKAQRAALHLAAMQQSRLREELREQRARHQALLTHASFRPHSGVRGNQRPLLRRAVRELAVRQDRDRPAVAATSGKHPVGMPRRVRTGEALRARRSLPAVSTTLPHQRQEAGVHPPNLIARSDAGDEWVLGKSGLWTGSQDGSALPDAANEGAGKLLSPGGQEPDGLPFPDRRLEATWWKVSGHSRLSNVSPAGTGPASREEENCIEPPPGGASESGLPVW